MTLFEGLAILVALRLWARGQPGVRVAVKSDSLSALHAFVKLVAHAPLLNQLTKELALELAEFSHPLMTYEHIPGITNTLADALSRDRVPECLVGLPQLTPPPRDSSWWLSC